MKIGLLGKGKTGGKVLDILSHREDKIELEIFDRQAPPTLERLSNLDGVISFLPGEAFVEHLDKLIQSRVVVVSGSTGMKLPDTLEQQLKVEKLSWVIASNFSLGMAMVRLMIEQMRATRGLFPESVAHIHEVHHTKKLDAPSGTALSFKEWLGGDAEITSAREGDVIGLHRLTLTTPSEQIVLEHEALDRRLFAEGAVWTLDQLLGICEEERPHGLIDFHNLVRRSFLS